ncbi:unnamed protein product [Protopolystoma xenopodis]|uniref:Uncharacterized protein n=1 Tax=Protopolystoma xenopodis TaxID=117903 RepID=A0A3S5CU08_9PLAT|nr:unnamed protein product [Protopolystoma xenopodis]
MHMGLLASTSRHSVSSSTEANSSLNEPASSDRQKPFLPPTESGPDAQCSIDPTGISHSLPELSLDTMNFNPNDHMTDSSAQLSSLQGSTCAPAITPLSSSSSYHSSHAQHAHHHQQSVQPQAFSVFGCSHSYYDLSPSYQHTYLHPYTNQPGYHRGNQNQFMQYFLTKFLFTEWQNFLKDSAQ